MIWLPCGCFERKRIMDEIDSQLTDQPMQEAHNRKSCGA